MRYYPHMDAPSPMQGLFQRRSVRLGLVAATATYLFLVCAAYMSREPVVPAESVAVFGPTVVRVGTEFPLRVVGFDHDTQAQSQAVVTKATVSSAQGDAELVLRESKPGVPGWVHLSPAPARTGPFEMALEILGADGDTRKVVVPMSAYDTALTVWPVPILLPEQVPDQELQIEVLTEGPGLAMQMLNRVWFRVTDRTGAPVGGASLSWTVKGGQPASGTAETDAAGLAAMEVRPDNLSTRFVIEAEKDGAKGHQEQTEQPLGRAALIRPSRLLQAAGEPPISLAVVQPSDGLVYCDLLREDAWIRTWHLESKNREPSVLAIDLPDEGVYRFQCYSHFANPGDGGDAVYLFRTAGSRLTLTTELLRAQGKGRTGVYRTRTPVVDDAALYAMMAGFRTKEVEVIAPRLLGNTRKDDVTAARITNDRTRARFMLLIGASFGMVILWAFYVGIQSAIEGRVRLAAAISELGEMAVDAAPPAGLVRARTTIQIALVLVALALNVIGMLALFRLM